MSVPVLTGHAPVCTDDGQWLPTGFTEVMPWQGVSVEESLPSCETGDTFTVDEIKLVEKQMSPPDYLTEAELITLMEKHGIGQWCLGVGFWG